MYGKVKGSRGPLFLLGGMDSLQPATAATLRSQRLLLPTCMNATLASVQPGRCVCRRPMRMASSVAYRFLLKYAICGRAKVARSPHVGCFGSRQAQNVA